MEKRQIELGWLYEKFRKWLAGKSVQLIKHNEIVDVLEREVFA